MTVASSISKIGETEAIFHQIVQVLQGGWTADDIWQIAAFAVAVLLSLFISSVILTHRCLDPLDA